MEELNQFEPPRQKDPRSQLIHDLRGSLNIILMAAEMLERKKDQLDPEYLHKQTTRIKENAQKINSLIEGIRTLQ